MAYEITHHFEELPLLIGQGAVAGLVDGRAVISIGSGRDWSIDAIYLDGYRDGQSVDVKLTNLPGTSEGAIYNIIFSALTSGDHETSIQEHVNEWLDGASERRADHMREVA
jgi:hypothetical protein